MYIMGSLDFYRNSGPAKMALCILIDGSSITKAMGQGASFSVVIMVDIFVKSLKDRFSRPCSTVTGCFRTP